MRLALKLIQGRKSSRLLLLAAPLIVVLAAGCGGGGGNAASTAGTTSTSASQANLSPIKIGVVGPATGAAAFYGQDQIDAIKLRVGEINAQGGVKGHPIRVFSEDDQGTPAESRSAVLKLINTDHVAAVVGAVFTTDTLADEPLTERAGVPLLTTSTGGTVTTSKTSNVYQVSISDPQQAQDIVNVIKKHGFKRIALATSSDSYGQSGHDALSADMKAAGMSIVADVTFTTSDSDFRSQIVKVSQAKPDAIVFWSTYAPIALFAKQARAAGISAPMFAGSGAGQPDLMKLGGSAVEGMTILQSFLPGETSPTAQHFVKAYEKKYGHAPGFGGAVDYDIAGIIAHAAGQVADLNSLTPGALSDAIAKTSGLKGVTGAASFNKNGRNIGAVALVTQVKNGQFVVVAKAS